MKKKGFTIGEVPEGEKFNEEEGSRLVMRQSRHDDAKELAEAHYEWFKKNLYEVFRVGYIFGVSASGEEYTDIALKESWELIEPLIGRIYVDSMVHGAKHGYDVGFNHARIITVSEEAVRSVEEHLVKSQKTK